jgi:tetratricopeptide (TPR) repeat protein
MATDMGGATNRVLWFAVVVFGLISLCLAWLSWRAWSHQSYVPAAPHTYDAVTATYTADLHEVSSRKELFMVRNDLARLMANADFEGALLRINEAERESTLNLWLLNLKATLLGQQKRFKEMCGVYDEMLALDGLRAETRTVVAIGALQSLVRDGQIDRFRTELQTIVQNRSSVLEKLFVLDCMASFVIYEPVPTLVTEALLWCEQALTLQPGNLTVRATRACLLFEAGNLEASEAQLKEIYALSESPLDKALTSLYLALVCKRRERLQEARGLARRALRHGKLPVVLSRLAIEFPGLSP